MPRGTLRGVTRTPAAPRRRRSPIARPEPSTAVVEATGGAGCVRFYCTTLGKAGYGVVKTVDGRYDVPVDGTYRTPRAAIDACDALNAHG